MISQQALSKLVARCGTLDRTSHAQVSTVHAVLYTTDMESNTFVLESIYMLFSRYFYLSLTLRNKKYLYLNTFLNI